MCGIAGQFGELTSNLTESMIKSIGHRGPDNTTTINFDSCYTAATCRLSITEIAQGSQPRLSRSGMTIVSFNGEIYNYREIARKTKDAGVLLRDDSECELLAAGLECWGDRFLDQVEGMFAIAYYNIDSRKLCLCRDRFGIKPLYYALLRNSVVYASELKAFSSCDIGQKKLNLQYLAHRQVFDFGPKGQTIFEEILAVKPGTILKFPIARNQTTERDIESPVLIHSTHKKLQHVEVGHLLYSAVSRYIPQEVSWGVLLSGGLDSSIIAACSREFSSNSIKTFTLSDETSTDDAIAAKAVAKFLASNHFESHCNKFNSQMLLRYVKAREEYETNSLYLFILCEFAAKQVSVALCGQGADELFGGYPFFADIESTVGNYLDKWNNLKKVLDASKHDAVQETLENLLAGPPQKLKERFHKLFMNEQLTWFQLEALDKCSMAHSLEVRVPYLDSRLANRILQNGSSLTLDGTKKLLRDAFDWTKLPTLTRPKQFSGRSTIPSSYFALDQLAKEIVSGVDIHQIEHSWIAPREIDAISLEFLLMEFGEDVVPDSKNIDPDELSAMIRTKLNERLSWVEK